MKPVREKIAGLKVLKAPGKGKKTVILFHGFGSSAGDLFPLHRINPEWTWIFPEGPLEVPISFFGTGHAWFSIDMQKLQEAAKDPKAFENAFPEETEGAKSQVTAFIDAIGIPLEECILGGFSQGAIVATDFALHAKEKVAALVILSGILVSEKNWREMAPTKRGIPFFQCHGKQDPILPYILAEKLEQLLQDAGMKGSLLGFEGGHEVSNECLIKLREFLACVQT